MLYFPTVLYRIIAEFFHSANFFFSLLFSDSDKKYHLAQKMLFSYNKTILIMEEPSWHHSFFFTT